MVAPSTRFVALLVKITKRPSAEIAGSLEMPAPGLPSADLLIRVLVPATKSWRYTWLLDVSATYRPFSLNSKKSTDPKDVTWLNVPDANSYRYNIGPVVPATAGNGLDRNSTNSPLVLITGL